MKKTVFFGAMATILMSAGANAAITQIASTDYVDSVVETKADAASVDALGVRVTANETAIQTNTGNITKNTNDITNINNTIGDATGMTVGGTPVETIVGAINALDAKVVDVDAYTKDEVDTKFQALGTLATKNSVSSNEIDASAVTTDKILDANVTEEKLSVDVVEKLNKTTDLTGYATEKWVEGKNYIPKPSPECAAASGTCVLTVNTDGALEWMAVTAPSAGE